MNMFFLKASEIFTEDSIKSDSYLKISGDKIISIGEKPEDQDSVIDLSSYRVVPGFIDLHIHGSGGHDVMDATYEALDAISATIAANGVTGFLGTTVTSTWDATLQAFENIKTACQKGLSGAELLGGYSEGLFFSERFKGAHAAEYFLEPTIERLDTMMKAAGGQLKLLAIAPELKGAIDAIQYLSQRRVKVMVGHTGATYEQTRQAFAAGAVGGVHIFNQMSGIHHRQPGAAGAVLHDKSIVAELIADGVHVDPIVMDLIYRLKGANKTALITDCICAGGLPDGKYNLGLIAVTVEKGVARTHTGALAGSTLSLNKAVANMINLVGVSPLDAVHMASLTPATLLDINHKVGSIKEGKYANLAVLDEHYNVVMTFVRGQTVYSKPVF